ncbi:MAG: nicotinate-nucleotide adenylyltransferase [Eubacteriales bacterium]|nr:nicotinate-nucleotide adenylyltransferase [Eubacteriales bacterium]
MSKIGIMGGTFDPIHNGHLALGRQAYEEYGLDQVWFMPSGTPPHKKDHTVTAAADRCEMVKLAIAGCPCFKLSDFEIRRPGNTYTADTLALLRGQYPEHEFYFIIGGDSLYEIERWYHPERIMKLAVLLAAGREYEGAVRTMDQQIAYLKERYGADIRRLHCREMDVSSNEVRGLEARGERIVQYVPKPVEAYIESHGLYQEKTL